MVFAFCAGSFTGFVIVLAGLARHQKIIMSVRCLYLLDLKGLFAFRFGKAKRSSSTNQCKQASTPHAAAASNLMNSHPKPCEIS
jgi:hypothetical protein